MLTLMVLQNDSLYLTLYPVEFVGFSSLDLV